MSGEDGFLAPISGLDAMPFRRRFGLQSQEEEEDEYSLPMGFIAAPAEQLEEEEEELGQFDTMATQELPGDSAFVDEELEGPDPNAFTLTGSPRADGPDPTAASSAFDHSLPSHDLPPTLDNTIETVVPARLFSSPLLPPSSFSPPSSSLLSSPPDAKLKPLAHPSSYSPPSSSHVPSSSISPPPDAKLKPLSQRSVSPEEATPTPEPKRKQLDPIQASPVTVGGVEITPVRRKTVTEGGKQPLILPAGFKEKPPALVCYMCGREFGTTSLAIHFKSCAKARERKQADLPPHKRTPCPEPPSLPIPTLDDPVQDFDTYNEQAMCLYKGELPTCTCGQKFPDFLRFGQHLAQCKTHLDMLERKRKEREDAEAAERAAAEAAAARETEELARRLQEEADEVRRRKAAEEAERRRRAEEAKARAEEERRKREEEKARLEAARKAREEELARNRKKFLKKGEGKTSNDERLRIETEKAIMQKRVRNFEARGLFDGGDVDVDDEDHWLLRQLATAATGEEDGEEGEGGGGGVDLKQVLHDPSKGAATLVQKAGVGLSKMATPVGDAEPIVPGAPLPVIPERPVTTVSNPALRAKTPAKTMGPSPSAPSLATQRPHTSTSKLKQFDGAATEEPPSSVAASKGKSSASGGAQPASAPGERPKSSNTSRATSIKRGKPLPEVPSAQSRTLAGQSDAGFVPEDAPIVPRRRQPSPISSGGKRKSLPNSLRQLVAQHGEMTGSDGSQSPGPEDTSQPPIEFPKLARFCHNCGTRYVDVAKFCHECGTKRVGT